jgi:peptidoglycan-N-acetylglucosamine deacetylase
VTPAMICTLVLHTGSAVLLVVDFALWRWVAGALAVNHLLLLAGVFLARARLLGPNLDHLPAAAIAHRQVCLTFDDGPHPDITWRVLELLERHRAQASFFCVGEKAEAYPEIVREIARRGHSVENHSHRHPNTFALYGIALLRREVETAQAALTAITGRAPQFFRAPMGLRSPLLGFVLARAGLRYVSWTRRGFDTVSRDPARVLARLTSGLGAGEVLLLHDTTPATLAVLTLLLEHLTARGLKCVSLAQACSLS